jgi:hypothetical protein
MIISNLSIKFVFNNRDYLRLVVVSWRDNTTRKRSEYFRMDNYQHL